MIPSVIAQIFNPIAKLLIPIGIPSKEAKAEIEIHFVIVEAKNKKIVQYNLELYKLYVFYCVIYSSIHFALFLQENNFLFHIILSLILHSYY